MNQTLKWMRGVLCALWLGVASGAWAVQLAGVGVDERAYLAQTELQLNGAGTRRAYFLEVYVASLYLPHRVREASQVLSMPGPKRLQLTMLLGASSQEFSKALLKGMRRNSTDEQYQRLQSRIDAFEHTINSYGAVRKGDVLSIDYIPEQGTRVLVNGQSKAAAIAGEDFYGKLLEIFVGAHVNDEPLKQKLLGN